MSSSSSVSTSTVNGTTRVTGLSSGLDVDSIVKQSMTAEKAKKLNKLQQKEQKVEWTQTAYRDITSDIQTFSNKYFNVTSSTSLLSKSNYLKNTVASTDSAVTATASSTASAGNHTIQVDQLATAATLKSSSSVSKDVQGSTTPSYSSLSDKSFILTLDGTSKTVTLDSTVTDLSSLQTAINDAVGSGKVTVSADSSTGYLSLTAADSGVQVITISAPTTGTSALSNLGFGTGAVLSNRLNTSSTLSTISSQLSTALTFNDDGQAELTINGTTLTFDKSDTLAEMISEVNKSSAGVTMKYDNLTGKLVMTASATGAGNTLVVTESSDSSNTSNSNFLTALLDKSTAGVDAKVTIDGQSLTRSSNTITVDGITYKANQTTTSAATVSVTQDTDGVYDLIKGFVDDYNTLIDTINTELTAKYDSDYPPLTDDQKDDMTDDQITSWETKAKVGLLHNDSILKSFVSDLRTSLIDSISGQSSTLSSIGITTGTYDTKGTLSVDETKLKAAIASDPEGIMNLFTQQASSTTSSGTSLSGTAVVRSLSSKDLSTRYKEEGIAYRFYDTLQKNISTIRDTAGNKGTLLEKAGTTNDASDTDNTLTKMIDKYTSEIDDEETRLDTVEDNLYTKYSKLETYINKMNSQLSSLSSSTSS
ncbi:flagellar filament capping protein FliD [Pelosinus sp. sgz500959]|uniref:flagellar filament capping protein FliD n=1 Tax=Pelosinus sp. sgz500959 TaxID=3242472 RepID=UPI00366C4438